MNKQTIQYVLQTRLDSYLRSIKNTEEHIRKQHHRYITICDGPRGKNGVVAKNVKNDLDIAIARVFKICSDVEKELSIIQEFNALLPKLTPETYWVYQIDSKEHLKQIIKERKATEALYRRKIKSMKFRLDKISYYSRC